MFTIFFINVMQETVSSSEDISAKTKSVIELKKLELLNLQRRLRKYFPQLILFMFFLQVVSFELFTFNASVDSC